MVSTKEVRKALYTKLNVAAVTGLLPNGSASLFHDFAPERSPYPLIIYTKLSGVARHALTALETDDQVWLVKAITNTGSASAAEDLAAAIAGELDHKALTIQGGLSLYVAREADVSYSELDGDTAYRHEGAQYRVVVS